MYCIDANDLPEFFDSLERLQIEFHDYIFDPRSTLQTWLPVMAPHLNIDSLMAEAVKRAGLYASPYKVYDAALEIIREHKASADAS